VALRVLAMESTFATGHLLLRAPGQRTAGLPRPFPVGEYGFQQVRSLVYLGAVITNGLYRQEVVHHRVRRARRSVAAILPLLLLFRFSRAIVVPALVCEVATTASTKRARATFRREAAILPTALLATARRPEARVPRLTQAVRRSRINYSGHISREPPGHLLRRALDFDLHRRKVGRP
jgi:hypothetical protein